MTDYFPGKPTRGAREGMAAVSLRGRQGSGGVGRRRAAGWEQAGGEGGKDPVQGQEGNEAEPCGGQRVGGGTGEELAVGHELDGAVMVGRVGILVQAVVQDLRGREHLHREVQAQHEQGGAGRPPELPEMECSCRHGRE